jgi:hypothetical protein
MSKSTSEAELSSNNTANNHDTIAPWQRPMLPRVPLVPDEVLKQHNAFCVFDSRFRKSARLLQCLWLRDRGIPNAVSETTNDSSVPQFASTLRADAAKAGRNFLNLEILQVAFRELLVREEGAYYDEQRLFTNALSSQPMTLNLFGNMAVDLAFATSVFKHLFPDFVHTVDHILFETSPGRREERFLLDGTAFDAAIYVTTPEGETATIFVETKYSEDMMGPAARPRGRYDEASRQVKLYREPDSPVLRSLGMEQLWRECSLAQLTIDQGVTSRAMFLAIGPALNRRVMGAFRAFQRQLIDPEKKDPSRVAFEPMSLETLVNAIRAAGADELAQALWSRYLDFERVYDLSLAAIGGDVSLARRTAPEQPNRMSLDGGSFPLGRRDRRILNKRTRQRAIAPVAAAVADDKEIAS